MTTFERDLRDALNGNEIEVLKRRKAELEKLEKEFKATKNYFRAKCLASDIARLRTEYIKISENF